MKSLEALERIKNNLKDCENYINLFDALDLNTIEKDLKALEIIKRTAMKLVSLEDSESGICCKCRYAIYDNELDESIDITKEEYDLLKEILK